MMGYVSVLLKILYQKFRINPHVVNPQAFMSYYKIEYIRQTSGVSPKLNFRKKINMIFEA